MVYMVLHYKQRYTVFLSISCTVSPLYRPSQKNIDLSLNKNHYLYLDGILNPCRTMYRKHGHILIEASCT